MNFCCSGTPPDQRALIGDATPTQGQGEAIAQCIAAQDNALNLRHRSHARRDHLCRCTGLGEPTAVAGDVGHIGLRQRANESNVQAKQPGIGMGRIEANLNISTANTRQRGQCSLYALCQLCAVGRVGDVSSGLTGKAQGESARWRQCRSRGIDSQQGQVFAFKRTFESDRVVGTRAAADLYRAANAGQGCIQGIAHGRGIGPKLDTGGGVGLAVIAQAQGKAATAAATDIDLLDF